jgi:hypothetical protein
VFVNLNADNFSRPDDFLGDGDVIRGRFEIVGRMVVGKIIAAELARMAGFRTSRGWTGADDRAPTETIFSPIISFLALSRATTNCSLSGCPLVRMRF